MEDERLTQIQNQKQEALDKSNNTYNDMLQNNQTMLDQQTNYANQYEQTQNEALDKQLDFYKQNIDKQKETAQQNYETEAKKAQNDFISYTNPYGYQAETMASKGQLQSGLSQTAQLGGYNTYQNRLATANKAMQDAFTQYDSDMNEAIMNNDVQKAQNALTKLEMILGYTETFYDNKNSIIQNQLANNQDIDSNYYNRYMEMVSQINTEKEREEAIRQFEAQLAYQKERDAIADAQWEKEYKLAQQSASKSSSSSSKSSSSSGGYSLTGNNNSGSTKIQTNYYTGDINPDVQYGTFGTQDKNGVYYQPNNVGGVPLKSSGKTVSEFLGTTGNTGKTGANIDNQKVWQTSNGDYYVWDGSQNKYVQLNVKTFSISVNENYSGGSGRRG